MRTELDSAYPNTPFGVHLPKQTLRG